MDAVHRGRRSLGFVLVAALAGSWPGVSAGASPEEGDSGGESTLPWAAATSAVCGGWWEERPDGFTSVTVCAADGVGASAEGPSEGAGIGDPFVYVARYACSHVAETCEGEQYEQTVPRDAVRLDPLLRGASVRTNLDGCVVDVEFAGVGMTKPRGDVFEYHAFTPAPVVVAAGNQMITRQAQWWGSVCGQTLMADEGEMWQGGGTGAGLDGSTVRGEFAEVV